MEGKVSVSTNNRSKDEVFIMDDIEGNGICEDMLFNSIGCA